MRRRAAREAEQSAPKAERERVQVISVCVDDICGGMIAGRKQTDETIAPLAASIARHGLLQPVVVRRAGKEGRYALVCGARRLAACRMLGRREIDVLLLDADAQEAAACFMEEHLTFQMPGAIDEAQMMAAAGREELLSETALDRALLARRLRLLDLPEAVQRIVTERRLSLDQAEPLLDVPDPQKQMEAALIIAERSLTPAQARRLIHGPVRKQAQDADHGRRRAVRFALEEISRMAEKMRAQGVDALVRVHSQEGGICVQLLLRHGEKRRGQQDFVSQPRIH